MWVRKRKEKRAKLKRDRAIQATGVRRARRAKGAIEA
jgi:hypothetical protein